MTVTEATQEFLLKQDLKTRLWTDGLISRLLIKPDEIKKRYGGGICHLYHKDRVELAESSQAFKGFQEKTLTRRQLSREQMLSRADILRQEISNHIRSLEIVLKVFSSKQELYQAAVYHYNGLWTGRGTLEKTASTKDSTEFLNRIATNMLRHSCDCYERELDSLFGKVGASDAYSLLKIRVNDTIVKTYPFLITVSPGFCEA